MLGAKVLIMEKKWKVFPGDNCPNCGDAIEVLSECAEEKDTDFETFAFDGEDVKCMANCGFESSIVVTEEGSAYVQEGNLEDLECD